MIKLKAIQTRIAGCFAIGLLSSAGISLAAQESEPPAPTCKPSAEWTTYAGKNWAGNEIVNLVTLQKGDHILWNGDRIDTQQLETLVRMTSLMGERPLTAVADKGSSCEHVQKVREIIARHGCQNNACLDAPNLRVPYVIPPPGPVPN